MKDWEKDVQEPGKVPQRQGVVLDTTNKLSYIILPFSQRLPVNPLTHLQMKPFPFLLQLPPCWQGLFLHGSVAEHERVIFIIVA